MSYLGNTPSQQAFAPAVDYFNGTGSATAFTLSRPVASVAQVQVTIENVPQNPSSSFTVSGSTITFTSAPPSGTSNIYVQYTSPITTVIAPGQGTVTATSMASSTGTGAGVFQTSPTITTPTISSLSSASATALTLQSAGTTAITVDTSQYVGIGTTSPTAKLNVSKDGGGGDASQIVRITDTNTANTFGPSSLTMGMMNHYAPNPKMSIAGTNGIAFCVGDGSDFTTQRKVEIDSSGNLLVGTTTSYAKTTSASAAASYVYASVSIGNQADHMIFKTDATTTGSITRVGGTNVAYNTSSDYRLKYNISPMTGALDKVAKLKPCTYTWRLDDSDGEGFIAHELAEVCPHAVAGEKDAVDENGDIKAQGIDTSFLVATLTAAIQEQQALIIQLQADVSALKGIK